MSVDARDAAQAIREQAEAETEERSRIDRFRYVVAVIIAGMAALLAVVALVAQNTEQAEITANIYAADSRSSMDVKTATLASTELLTNDLQRQLADPGLPATSRPGIQQEIDTNRAAAAKLQSDPVTGLGIKELGASLDESEKEAELLSLRGRSYDYAEVLLEISVLLGSVGLLTVRKSIVGLSLLATAISVLFFINGFTLIFHF